MNTTGRYLLEALLEAGMDRLFVNLGTDHVTIIEELARARAEGRAVPDIIVCPHENVAVHMAGGYAIATGQGQAVLVHVDAGTANAAMALHNLARTRVPVLLMAGRSPHTLHGELPGSRDNYVHFVQDPFDIGSLVRPYVKWEYNLATGVNVKEVVRRAHSVMHSEPPGPVFLTLPRETLAEEWDGARVHSYPAQRYGAVLAGGARPGQAEAIAEALMQAEQPIAITSYLGRRPEAVAVLDALAREAAIAVIEMAPTALNIPHESPCFAGFDPLPVMARADLGLLLDVDVPYLPKFAPDAGRLRWLQVDVDAAKKDFPMWGFPADLRVQGDCATVLGEVLAILRARGDEGFRGRAAARLAGLEEAAAARRQGLARAARAAGEPDAISVPYLCAALAARMAPEDVLVNESVRNSITVSAQIPRSLPGTYVGSAGGGLGFSGGAALGIKLAEPRRRVIQIVGDGVFHFTSPDAVYATAARYGLPILTVVLDNRGWQAVKMAVLRVYPDGAASQSDEFHARLDDRQQGAQRRFEDIGRAFGAHGEGVSDPAGLSAAIDRCFAAIDRGQAAVLNVRVSPL